jgi:hypothetical protein
VPNNGNPYSTGTHPAPKPMATPGGKPMAPGSFSNPSRGTGYRVGNDVPNGGEPTYRGSQCPNSKRGA